LERLQHLFSLREAPNLSGTPPVSLEQDLLILGAQMVPLGFLSVSCYIAGDFGRAENRSRRKSGEESPNIEGRDAA